MDIKKILEVMGWLTALLLFAYASHAALAQTAIETNAPAQDESPARMQSAPLTPEETREARALASLFIRRLIEQDDLAPLVAELFVSDFKSRLRHDSEAHALSLLAERVRAEASDEELLGFYVAAANLTLTTIKSCHGRAFAADDSGSAGNAELEELFPPDVVRQLKTNPVLARWMLADSDEAQYDEARVKSLAELREARAAFERIEKLLRPHAPALAQLQARERERFARAATTDETVWKPELATGSDAAGGRRAGTRPVSVRLQPLMLLKIELEMAREDGQLKISAMRIEIDGD